MLSLGRLLDKHAKGEFHGLAGLIVDGDAMIPGFLHDKFIRFTWPRLQRNILKTGFG